MSDELSRVMTKNLRLIAERVAVDGMRLLAVSIDAAADEIERLRDQLRQALAPSVN